MKRIISILSLLFLFVVLQLNAQTPDLYPPIDPAPIDFTLQNIILYIVMPLVLIVVFLLYRRKKRKEAKKKEEEKNSK